MRLAHIFRLRLRSLFSTAKVEEELTEELQYHVERQIEENVASGMSYDDARRAVRSSAHGLVQRKEECRDARGLNLIENTTQDIRFAVRQLRKKPAFTLTAILMLALGMCGSIAIFAFVDAALVKPLPYQSPAHLVAVFETTVACPRCNVSYLDFRDWQKQVDFFSSLDAWGYANFLLRTADGAQQATGARVTDGFFRTLGIRPILGRDFYIGEDAPGAPHTVLISYGAWQKRFGGNPNVVGQTVTLTDISHTIIGVLPTEFNFAWLGPAEFWAPLNEPNSCEQRRGCHSLFGVGRLKDGVTVQTALAGMKLIAQLLEKRYPDSNRGFAADVLPLREVVSGKIRPILLTLLGGAGLLLLIACVNVSGLLVVRSEGRKREIAVRSALGASRARIYRQFVTEGLALVSAGCLLGLLLSYWAMRLLTSLIPADQMAGMPFLLGLGLNARVLGFSGVIALLAVVLFSLAPSLHFSSKRTAEGLAEGSRGSAGLAWRRAGPKLVVVELATAVVLLVAAGLLGKSFYKLLHVDTGMQPDHLATLALQVPNTNLTTERVRALERGILGAVESLPGVKSAGISTSEPITSWSMATFLVVVGRPWNGEHNDVPARWVSAGYLKTLGAKLVRGRYFTEAEDDESKPPAVLINQTFARKYFPGEDPLGKRLAYERSKDSMEIVGIVEDIKEGQLDTENRATMYAPFTQGWYSGFGLVVRASGGEQSLFSSITAAIHQVDRGMVAAREMSMSEVINNSQSAYVHRTSAWLVGGFAALALVLAVVGLYGTISYSVSQRRREIGIRMALGSDSHSVCRLILKEAGWLTAGGIVLGLGFALAAGALIRGLLFGVQSWDILTLITVAAALATVATLASYIPARRAASVNPLDALRAE